MCLLSFLFGICHLDRDRQQQLKVKDHFVLRMSEGNENATRKKKL